jgi:hypothetical protein
MRTFVFVPIALPRSTAAPGGSGRRVDRHQFPAHYIGGHLTPGGMHTAAPQPVCLELSCSLQGAPRRHYKFQPFLNQVCAVAPPGMVITLPADRGFLHERLIQYASLHQWHFRLRISGSMMFHRTPHDACAAKSSCPPVGHMRFFHQVALLEAAVGPVHLALACPIDHSGDPYKYRLGRRPDWDTELSWIPIGTVVSAI